MINQLLLNKRTNYFHLLPSIHYCLSRIRSWGCGLSREAQSSLSTSTSIQLFNGNPEVLPGHLGDIVYPASGLHLVGYAWRTSQGRRPGGIQIRCLWGSSGSTLSPSWMTEHLILYLRKGPDTLWWNIIKLKYSFFPQAYNILSLDRKLPISTVQRVVVILLPVPDQKLF